MTDAVLTPEPTAEPADADKPATLADRFTAVRGALRGGLPQVFIKGPRDARTTVVFNLHRGKRKAAVLSLNWPQDFTFKDAENPDTGEAVLGDFADAVPVSAILVEVEGQPVELGKAWVLVRMFATSEADFVRAFFRRRNRTQDRETQLFAARQILNHYKKNQSHRCVAAVIQGYRAIDLDDLEAQKIAARHLAGELRVADRLPLTGNPRTDREHLTVSMGFCLWQLYLAAGNYKKFQIQLDRTVAFLQSVDLPFPGIILNGCSTLFVRGFIHLLEGERDAAVAMNDFNAEFYVRHMPRLPRKAIWFKENLHSLNCVQLGLEMNERLRAGLKPIGASAVIDAANRVNYPPAVAKLDQNFSNYARFLRKARRAAAPGTAGPASEPEDEEAFD